MNRAWTSAFNEAPEFYWLYTLLVALGAGVILWPNFPLVKMILASQVLNGVLLPFVLIYMVLLINKKGLMKEWTNSAAYNAVAWVSVAIMIGLTLALASITVKQMMQARRRRRAQPRSPRCNASPRCRATIPAVMRSKRTFANPASRI